MTQKDPKLIAIAGPLKETEIVLAESEVTFGRESTNRVCLADLSVSRRHFVLERSEGGLSLRDLDSFNGTFVNGVPVKERRLEHGDKIMVGDSLFLVVLREDDVASLFNTVQMDEERSVTHETVRLRQEESFYLGPKEVLDSLPPDSRLARDLNALFRISTSICSIRTLDGLARELFELIFAAVPAESGAILLVGDRAEADREDFTSVFGWDRLGGADRPVRVSRTIVRQVLKEGVAILSRDTRGSSRFEGVESLVALKTRSLLAVPLAIRQRQHGVIYLGTSDPTSGFDENHLQLLTAIAGIAAVALENVRMLEWLENENRRLSDELNISHNLVGESPRLREVLQLISKVAPTESTVFICGESGTGKELAARAIHVNSPRAGKPFVAINCAALNEALLENELFGHEKGGFTHATAQKKGKLEVADGGTVFLDEIGEMTPQLQAKMLRVLQEREFERVGGTQSIRTNIRVITATNRDLEEMIREGKFRQDLYFRLNVVSLEMPPLRERREDIPLLAKYFVTKSAERCNRTVKGITPEAGRCLVDYEWPGNVRELENAIERAVVLGSSDLIQPEDLPDSVLEAARDVGTSPGGGSTEFHEAVKDAKKKVVIDAIERAHGNVTEAAKLLGIHPNNLHRLIRNLNLRTELKK